MALDDKTIEELKAKHSDLMQVEEDGTSLVFRKPTRTEYDRWFDKRNDQPTAAARELAQSTLVYPARDEMIAMLDRKPALLMCAGGVLDVITKMAGVGSDPVAKKL